MKILFYTIAFSSIHQVIDLYNSLIRYKAELDFLVIDHSDGNLDMSSFKKDYDSINVISQKNCGYSGAFNAALSYAHKNNFTHLVHINDDVKLFENTINNLINNSYFENDVLTGCEYNKKNQIVSFGSQLNYITGILTWNNSKSSEIIRSFSNQGALFSIPVRHFLYFKLPNLFMYCEELYFGLFMKKKNIRCFALPGVEYIHDGAPIKNELSDFKIYYITRNKYIVFREMTSTLYCIYVFIFLTIRGILNLIYRFIQFKFTYSINLFFGIIHGFTNKRGMHNFKK